MAFAQRLREVREGFQPAFWVANITELFERLSYYGVFAVIAIYLTETLKFSESDAGDLIGFFSGIVWFLPILGGTLADRFGFKRSLAVAYLLLSIGYFLLGSLPAPWMAPVRDMFPLYSLVLVVLFIPAMGPAVIKPCVVGTTARASTENVRSLGYSIYYTLVNVGGTLGPIMAYSVRRTIGIENVFRVCAVSVFLMVFGVLFFYKEPESDKASQAASIGQSFKNLWTVLTNGKFMTFLVIFSGFWIMFWQEFIALPLYLRKYVNPNADVDLLTTVDPLAVILLQIPISYLIRNWRPFTAMTTGMLITSFAWVILAVADMRWQINATWHLGSIEIPVQGIPVFAAIALFVVGLGEMVQSPRFYEYVSRLAPPGQQGVFMGFSFLPIAIGSAIAGVMGGRVVNYFGEQLGKPQQLWWVFAGVGFAATLGLFLYDRIVKPGETKMS